MRIDFQFSIAGFIEVPEDKTQIDITYDLQALQSTIQYSAESRGINIDGITLGWKERSLTPLEIMQKMESDQAKTQYDPTVHGTADSPVEPKLNIPPTAPSGNPDAPHQSDKQILAERAREALHGGPDSDGGV